ncbi:nitrate ABC transporter substrate-binding protein [Symbiopectobacterium sp.]|uniref:nitrate ABC transporter substrate-binding protein n=1 Tax=Symbiopectobacterium sp. TaxID=2952789 RepID=UPI003F3021ED
MTITIRLAVRDWDYFTLLALGDIKPKHFTLMIDRVEALPQNLANSPHYDAGEISFSRYARNRAGNDESLLALPHFLMRGFRQRCILTTEDSPLNALSQLVGKRIGVTGWHHSGSVWTRAMLRREGIETKDAHWYAGRLTDAHPIMDRLGNFGQPGNIEPAPGEQSLISLLKNGELDAICTPFMPDGYFSETSGLRQLLRDFRQAELDYFRAVGYIPGIHVLGMKPEIAQAHPWLPQALSEVIDQSYALWMKKRIKYTDTTPWLLDDLRRTARDLPANWNENGFEVNKVMIADFARELYEQKITEKCLTPEALFPYSCR